MNTHASCLSLVISSWLICLQFKSPVAPLTTLTESTDLFSLNLALSFETFTYMHFSQLRLYYADKFHGCQVDVTFCLKGATCKKTAKSCPMCCSESNYYGSLTVCNMKKDVYATLKLEVGLNEFDLW